MPGGRLGQADRERIAAGLAGGLGYAEIARELGRPTSTVSREVARNGGREAYRAGPAQQATTRRTRRARRPSQVASSAPAAGDPDGPDRPDPATVNRFVGEFAEVMVQTGLPRMAARVFACLVTTDSGALTAAELVQRLAVSPAAVSKAVGYLEGLAVIRRERWPRQRRERYLIDDDIWLQAWLASAQTHAVWAETAQRGVRVLGSTSPAGRRLDQMGQFFAQLSADMSGGPSEQSVRDLLTVLAGLLHAGVPRTADELAAALGWPRDRVTAAMLDAQRRPDLSGAVTLIRADGDRYTAGPRLDWLTPEQATALRPG